MRDTIEVSEIEVFKVQHNGSLTCFPSFSGDYCEPGDEVHRLFFCQWRTRGEERSAAVYSLYAIRNTERLTPSLAIRELFDRDWNGSFILLRTPGRYIIENYGETFSNRVVISCVGM